MSSEVLWWEPFSDNRKIGKTFKTLRTEYEDGVEQRRAKWPSSKLILEYSFQRSEDGAVDGIVQFFEDRQGAYEDFYSPIWEWISTMSAAASGQSYITVSDRSIFSPTAGVRGNAVFLSEPSFPNVKHEVKTIDSFGATAGLMYLDSAISYTYSEGIPTFLAVKVRMFEDSLEQAFFSKYSQDLTLRMIEV